jgi:hypothetical protein
LIKVAGRLSAHIRGQVGLATNETASAHKLVQPVVVGVLLVPEASAIGPHVDGAETVMPVVGVGETAAGPAQDGRLHGTHHVDERSTDTALVGDLRLLADPYAVVDHPAQLFDEVGVDLRGDSADGLGRKNLDMGVDLR